MAHEAGTRRDDATKPREGIPIRANREQIAGSFPERETENSPGSAKRQGREAPPWVTMAIQEPNPERVASSATRWGTFSGFPCFGVIRYPGLRPGAPGLTLGCVLTRLRRKGTPPEPGQGYAEKVAQWLAKLEFNERHRIIVRSLCARGSYLCDREAMIVGMALSVNHRLPQVRRVWATRPWAHHGQALTPFAELCLTVPPKTV